MTFERAAECESIGGQDYDCDSAWPKEAIRGKRLKDGKKSVHFYSCNNRFSSEKWGLSKRKHHVYVHGARCWRGIQRQRNVGGYDQPRTLGQLGQLIVFLLSQVELCVLFFNQVSISLGDFFCVFAISLFVNSDSLSLHHQRPNFGPIATTRCNQKQVDNHKERKAVPWRIQ